MKISLIQMNSQPDRAANLAQALRLMRDACAGAKPDLLVLPEHFDWTGGTPEDKRQAADLVPGGEAYEMVRSFAGTTGVAIHAGSLLERRLEDARIYNTSVVFDASGSEIGSYRKIHLFDITAPDGKRYAESAAVAPGDTLFVYEIAGFRVGCAIGDVTLSLALRLADSGGEMSTPTISYKNHRFPPQVIARAVWLYFRFPLSLRMVEEMLLERGIVVSYETIRRWGRKFGPAYARQLRRRKPSRKDIWHLDEVVISIAGRKHWLWRAVDQDGYVLDEIVQTRRNTKAAKRLLIRLLKKQGMAPKRIITDKLRSYSAARRDVMPNVEHRSHKGLNNRAENSHLPLRKRERIMQGFRSVGGLQRFISIFSAVRNLFVASHKKRSALTTHIHRVRATAQWNAVTAELV